MLIRKHWLGFTHYIFSKPCISLAAWCQSVTQTAQLSSRTRLIKTDRVTSKCCRTWPEHATSAEKLVNRHWIHSESLQHSPGLFFVSGYNNCYSNLVRILKRCWSCASFFYFTNEHFFFIWLHVLWSHPPLLCQQMTQVLLNLDQLTEQSLSRTVRNLVRAPQERCGKQQVQISGSTYGTSSVCVLSSCSFVSNLKNYCVLLVYIDI